MIELYTWNTPNGQKPAILLQELNLPYDLKPIDIGAGDQHTSDFLRINPNAKIPALIDKRSGQTVSLFESGAILIHIAKNTPYLPSSGQAAADALAWSFWQVGGLGPMIGQWGHFQTADQKIPYAIDRYLKETERLYEVLESQLANRTYLAGDSYTIADMMIWPWASGGLSFLNSMGVTSLPDLPHTKRWLKHVGDRPAVKTALEKLTNLATRAS